MADIETNRAMNDDTILLIIYFDGNFPNAKLRPYDDYKPYAIKTKIILSVDWLVTCNNIVIVVTN